MNICKKAINARFSHMYDATALFAGLQKSKKFRDTHGRPRKTFRHLIYIYSMVKFYYKRARKIVELSNLYPDEFYNCLMVHIKQENYEWI